MRKIALKGLIGQKRDTLLLWSVVALAFLFLVLSTTLITSLQETDRTQRITTYGSWQNMVGGLSSEDAEKISEFAENSAILPMVNVKGVDYFSGDNEYYITRYSDELVSLGQLVLKEGKWPESKNDIVLEYARLSSLNLKLGDSFTVVSQIRIPLSSSKIIEKQNTLNKLTELAKEDTFKKSLEIFRSKAWDEYMYHGANAWYYQETTDRLFSWYSDSNFRESAAFLFADEEHPDGRVVPFEEMTEEQLRSLVDYYIEISRHDLDLTPYMTEEELAEHTMPTADLIGYQDLNIRVSVNSNSLLIYIPYTYTVCGVVDTFSDRWDSGMLSLPSGFVTEENYDIFVSGQKKVLEKYSEYNFVPYENVVFIGGGKNSSARELWNDVLPVFNEISESNSEAINAYYDSDIQRVNSIGHVTKHEYQYSFDFYLCDDENEKLVYGTAVLVPESGNNPLNYNSAEKLSEKAASSIQIPAEYFVETDLDKIIVPASDGALSIPAPQVKNASVRIYIDGAESEMPFDEFISGDFEINGMRLTSKEHIFPESADEQDDFTVFRVNRYAYPSSSEGNDRMLLLVTIILFVTTVCAVFQIFFTQMRKRLRRIVLMKSIGAESSQIAKMLLWEFIYFWITTLPVGTVIGLGGAYAITGILEDVQSRDILYTIDPVILAAALFAGTFALFIGMIIPSIMAVGVPLTGRTARKKPLPPPKKETRQDFFNVTVRGLIANRSRTLGNFALCVFMMLITTLCLFIGFRFMTPYRETVQRDSRPDYFLSLPFSASDRQLPEYIAELEALGVCESIEVLRTANDSIIKEDSVNSFLLDTAFGDNLKTVNDSYGAEDLTGYPINLYVVSSESELFERFNSAATYGSIDKEAFDSGKEVLVFVPLYKDTGKINESAFQSATGWDKVSASGVDMSFYEEYRHVYDTDSDLSVGDFITIGAQTRYIGGMSYTYKIITERVRVGAIVYYFPDEGIWPISGSDEGYQVICSSKLCGSILPNSMRTRSSNEIRSFKIMYISTGYGTTDFYINAKEGLSKYDVDTALLIYARNEYMDIEFYHESNSKLLQDAINNILLVCLLGLTAVLLALMIFANTVTSDIEQERNRIGILQSLGVSNRQLIKRQLYIGLVASGLALIIANAVLWIAVAVYAAFSDAVLGNLLWGYPWLIHIALCIALAVIITLLYIMPMHSLRRYLPIENIKTRK